LEIVSFPFSKFSSFNPDALMKPVKIPIEDVLDLHTFRPEDIPDLLADYFTECINSGIYSVRIIHGKGKGIQKRRVQGILKKSPVVNRFKDAPPEAGGWGATLVELNKVDKWGNS
jgi:DNA-nicking Smr family endonuclease